MPKKRRKRKTQQTQPYKAAWEPRFTLSEDASRDIISLVLLFLGATLLLADFQSAGKFGALVFGVLKNILGLGAFFIGPIFLLLSLAAFRKKIEIKPRGSVGLLGLLASISGLFALVSDGGVLGSVIDKFLIGFLSFPLVLLLLIFSFAASLIIMSDRNLFSLFQKSSVNEVESVEVARARPKLELSKLFTKRIKEPKQEAPVRIERPAASDNWDPYPLELLDEEAAKPAAGDIEKQSDVIKNTLGTFNVEVTMGDIFVGPTVTQFTLKPDEGVRLNEIEALSKDLSLALAAHPLRIEAPIPGKALAGIEVPNRTPQLVRLKPLLESKDYAKISSELGFPLGRSVAGEPFAVDLKDMPHLLIAGATNSGKSVAINSMLLSLIYRNSPETLRLILVDPKRVELVPYNGLPHLLSPVITEPEKTISALKWAVDEMDRRFKAFSELGARNIEEFRSKKKALPNIVIVIDELADLMQVAMRDVEGLITRLAQMARATGIHLVVATQRPSVNVITGLIKANITSRIAFSVASQVDSRTILDFSGAEKLLGHGDLLFISSNLSKPKRVQGTYVSEKEIEGITKYLKRGTTSDYDEDVTSQPVHLSGKSSVLLGDVGEDELFDEAAGLAIRAKKASASLLQRHLRIGYARAARLLDMLEERGVVGPGDGAKPRDVLVDSLDEVDDSTDEDSSGAN